MVIIGTRPGERQMLYDFGCRIHELMFAPSNSATARLASQYVHEALGRWESRIEVLRVGANFDPSGAIMVQLVYRIRATGQVECLYHEIMLELCVKKEERDIYAHQAPNLDDRQYADILEEMMQLFLSTVRSGPIWVQQILGGR